MAAHVGLAALKLNLGPERASVEKRNARNFVATGCLARRMAHELQLSTSRYSVCSFRMVRSGAWLGTMMSAELGPHCDECCWNDRQLSPMV